MHTLKKLLILLFVVLICEQLGIHATEKEDPKKDQDKNRLVKVMAFDPEVKTLSCK